eukprot:gnl/MRDRNA2_/MRDRNA2_137627_c0_seq1.p1 gnl/MRDRNA2_/MRDRNA2_137627_c0~~gnl/MRDRNA2_/MRDRNA2_137627_c0_seq1.p1  ORF type:complete len:186 (-),score=16.80 gnl/MRDRNA2_/MRDRNA2_137627_c0_seq1:15-572(-)
MIRFLRRALFRLPASAFLRPLPTRAIRCAAFLPVGGFAASFMMPGNFLRCDAAEKWIQSASGLKYREIVEGTGDTPKRGQTVRVHYTGRLESNGVEFDSSIPRGEPLEFKVGVGQVIPGWDEGILTMKVGGHRQLIIPPHLGYGRQGAGRVIPPNATLIFDCELVAIGASGPLGFISSFFSSLFS